MALVALDGTPLVVIGAPFRATASALPAASTVVQDAANEACIMFGHIITDDGASHTIDTSGSSSLGWRTGAVTFANAGTTFKVGLAAVDTATGPAARAANVADVITLSVSKSHTGGGGGVSANAWQANVPSAGTLAVANGDFIAFCTQMTARGGADSIVTQVGSADSSQSRPGITSFVGAAYSATAAVPNALITFSDGHLGWFFGGNVFATSLTTQTWNSSSGTKEYGNFLQLPFPVKVYGIHAAPGLTENTDLILYSDPLGTPVAEKTVSIDLNTVGQSGRVYGDFLFTSPYTTTANQPLAVIAKPTSTTNMTMAYKTFNAAADQVTEMCGTNGYAVNRNAGAFAAQNSNKDRFAIGLLVGAFDAGGSTGRAIQINNPSLVA